MNGIQTFLTMIPFGCTALMGSADNSYLQYGALGLCALIVVFLCNHISKLTDKLDRKDKVLGELYERNTKAYNRLASLLEDRPCLMKDRRIQEETDG